MPTPFTCCLLPRYRRRNRPRIESGSSSSSGDGRPVRPVDHTGTQLSDSLAPIKRNRRNTAPTTGSNQASIVAIAGGSRTVDPSDNSVRTKDSDVTGEISKVIRKIFEQTSTEDQKSTDPVVLQTVRIAKQIDTDRRKVRIPKPSPHASGAVRANSNHPHWLSHSRSVQDQRAIPQAPTDLSKDNAQKVRASALYSSGSFDDDALPMNTPRSTWGRNRNPFSSLEVENRSQVGSGNIEGIRGPRHLSHVLQRSMSSVPPSHEDIDRKELQTSITNIQTTLTRMLKSRADSQLSSIEAANGPKMNDFAGHTSGNRYVFNDSSDSINDIASSQNALTEDETHRTQGLRLTGMAGVKARTTDHGEPAVRGRRSSLNLPGSLSPPEMVSRRPSSISRGASEPQIRRSPSSPSFPSYRPPFQSSNTNRFGWALHSMSRGQMTENQYRHRNEEEEYYFGGVDGNAEKSSKTRPLDAIESSYTPDSQEDPKLAQSSIGSAQLATRHLNTSSSMPQLQRFCKCPQERPSAPHNPILGVDCGSKNILTKGLALFGLSSDRVGTPEATDSTESHRSSIIHLTSKPSDFGRRGRINPSTNQIDKEIISVPASSPKRIDVDRLERKTYDETFQLGNEALSKKTTEFAKAFLPREHSLQLAGPARLMEDLNEVASELEKTKPGQFRSTGLDGAGDERLTDLRTRSSSGRLSIISSTGDISPISVWDKAFRDHFREDRLLSKTRLGSEAHSFITTRSPSTQTQVIERKKSGQPQLTWSSPFLTVKRPEEAIDLQTRLGSYRLPPPKQAPPAHPPKLKIDTGQARSSECAWAKYPSHSLEDRSPASAGEADNVFARDFAVEAEASDERRAGYKRRVALILSERKGMVKSKSMTFGRSVTDQLKGLYNVGQLEFSQRYAPESRGHRSSISDGELVYTQCDSSSKHVRSADSMLIRDGFG